MRSLWNTRLPGLSEVNTAVDDLAEKGLDVHTVKLTLNGQHGGWDVTLEATDQDMDDVRVMYTLGNYGAMERVDESLCVHGVYHGHGCSVCEPR